VGSVRRLLRMRWRVLVALTAGIVAYLVIGPLGLTDRYQNFVITTVAVYAIVTLSVSELAGLSGIWSVGHMSFVAIGAYSMAYFSSRGLALPLIVLFAMAAAAAVGFLLGLTAGRFSVLYLAILTLALALVAGEVIGRWVAVTGGDQGEAVAPIRVFGERLTLDAITGLSVGTATVIFVIADLAARGRWGRRWLAVKNQRTAAVAIGLNPSVENATAFASSAALAAVAGIVLALQIGYISPDFFSLMNAINFIVASVVGGVGSIAGAVLGASFIVVLPEAARVTKDLQVIVFGVITIAVLLFVPEGIVPGLIRRGAWPASLRRLKVAQVPLMERHVDFAWWLGERHGAESSELVVEKVSVQFGGLTALQDVALRIAPREVVALIGPNGAGKTTFLNVLGGFVRPVKGALVRFGGHDLLTTSAQRRTQIGIGRTFQHAELFDDLNVLDTVTLAAGVQRRHHAERPAAIAAAALDMLDLARYSGERPGSLPFGIQKRVDIARALATRPSLIVMDEPFSGLDLNEQKQLHELILAFRKGGISVLLVDHAVQEVLSLADRVYVLDYGRMIAEGSPADIRRSEAVKEAYFGKVDRSAKV
jgi:ABC-type branched-subunit amino acid transport system ATPase component/ABC-type branched-subunit amino acid transport system permease subunit